MPQLTRSKRHIDKSCWKICDECVEVDNKTCDSNHTEGDCTACAKSGKTCTKYDEQIPDCAPEPVADAANTSTSDQRKAPRAERSKRQARGSPDASPESKPKSKRKYRKRDSERERREREREASRICEAGREGFQRGMFTSRLRWRCFVLALFERFVEERD